MSCCSYVGLTSPAVEDLIGGMAGLNGYMGKTIRLASVGGFSVERGNTFFPVDSAPIPPKDIISKQRPFESDVTGWSLSLILI